MEILELWAIVILPVHYGKRAPDNWEGEPAINWRDGFDTKDDAERYLQKYGKKEPFEMAAKIRGLVTIMPYYYRRAPKPTDTETASAAATQSE